MDAKGNRLPSTVTVTPLAANVTQIITVTAQAQAAESPKPPTEASNMPAAVNPPAGVNPPEGAAGTGGTGSKTAAIVKTSDAANADVG